MGNRTSTASESGGSQELQPTKFRYISTEHVYRNSAFEESVEPPSSNTDRQNISDENYDSVVDQQGTDKVETNTIVSKIKSKKNVFDVHLTEKQDTNNQTNFAWIDLKSSDNLIGSPVNYPHVVKSSKFRPSSMREKYHQKTQRIRRRLSMGDNPHCRADVTQVSPISPADGFLLGRVDCRCKHKESYEHTPRITQVAPSNGSIYSEDDGSWKIPINHFSSKKKGPNYKQMSKRTRSYYKAQDEVISSFEEIQLQVDDAMANAEDTQDALVRAAFLAKLTFAANIVLLVAKAAASALSASMAIISSLVDSAVDLVSGILLWWATRAIKKRDPYVYPQGRTKLEPVVIIVIAVVMSVASLQLMRESVQKMVDLSGGNSSLPVVKIPTFVIAGSTVVIKFVLWILCRRVKSPSVQTLALDHRNDVLSNSIALICGYLGSQEMFSGTGLYGFRYTDPAGAILLSFYIVYNWWKTGSEQMKFLTGHTAEPNFLRKLTWICVNHHKKIRHIESVRAFHFGNNFLVEVDIVLPPNMSLKEAHDIGEPLQQKLESLPEVERAFVHVDYNCYHKPNMEHKIV